MPHILITDDDPHLRRLVRTYAELEGFECTEAGDGAAAVTALKQSAFDLVLLDVMMPGPALKPSKPSAASARYRSSC